MHRIGIVCNMFEDEHVEPPQATTTVEDKPSRQYQESKVIPYPAIRELLNRIVDPYDKWLIGTTYANGNRISETLALKFGDFNWDNDFLYIQSIVKKKRGRKVKGKAKQSPKPPKRRNFPIPRDIEPWLTEDIIKFVEQGRKETPELLVWPKCKVSCNGFQLGLFPNCLQGPILSIRLLLREEPLLP